MKQTNITLLDGSIGILTDWNRCKILESENYKFVFDKKTGRFARWGKTQEDDGDLSLGLPEIADIEISTICHGINGKPCAFCYKANSGSGKNMTLETFKKLFHKLPLTVGQIAFGIGDIDSNPDMFDIFEYSRAHGVIPNVTVNGWNIGDYAERLSNVLGAIAVSNYDYDLCCTAVKQLTDTGMTQVNIHNFLSQETLEQTWKLLKNVKTDPRLAKLNAIVMLSLKKQGRAKSGFNRVSDEDFKELVFYALENNIGFGFDSCTAAKFADVIRDTKYYASTKDMIEPCESTLYSVYINCDAEMFPCSFGEGADDWKEGLNVLECNNFLKDIWWHERTLKFKEKCIHCRENNISCPAGYDI